MVSRNDVTGDAIQSKTNSNTYRDNWDKIFSKKDDDKETVVVDATKGSDRVIRLSILVDYDELADAIFKDIVGMSIKDVSMSEMVVVYHCVYDTMLSAPHIEEEYNDALAHKLSAESFLIPEQVKRLNTFFERWKNGDIL